MKLELPEQLTSKELKRFGLTQTINIDDFYGYQYCCCLCIIEKDNNGEYVFRPLYEGDINKQFKPNQVISLAESYKETVIKERCYIEGKFATIYYIKYVKKDKPTLLNDLNYFNKNHVDVELILNENGYYRPVELHLELEPFTSVMKAIHTLFSNENKEVLSFVQEKEDKTFFVTYYNDFGKIKNYDYQSFEEIFDRITTIRLVGCKEVFNADNYTTTRQAFEH